MAIILLFLLAVPMAIIALLIKIDSPGAVIYRQDRVTTYGHRFKIHKFRTMVNNADEIGTSVTSKDDYRITKIGKKIRAFRLDELPQVIDILQGNMSFVGTRPEATKYVEQYKPEYFATFLMPAGVTSEASIYYKDEDKLLLEQSDIDKIYIEQVLPEKMKLNLKSLTTFSFLSDISIMFRTIGAVLQKEDK